MIKRFTLIITLIGAALLNTRGTVVLHDGFTYADGSLTNVSGGKWFIHSGNGNGLAVVSSAAQIAGSATLTDDLNAALTNAPFSTNIYAALYAKMTVRLTTLPNAGGAYFAHFKDNGTANFRARVWANATGAGAGTFRLGVSSAANAFTNIATDLSLNTTYTIVVKYVLATGVATLWLNPVDESSASVTSGEAVTSLPDMTTFGLRQATGQGTINLDDLLVGTSFSDVVPGSLNPPFFTVNPANRSVGAGTTVIFTGVAGGTEPLSYQWYFSNSPISGATFPSLTNASVSTAAAGPYFVVATNITGISATSSVATLTVSETIVAPTITNQPTSQTSVLGSPVTFSVGASGTDPLSYRWRFNGTNLPGATAAFYTISSVGTNNAGPYDVVVTNVAGGKTSEVAILTVVPPPATNIAYLHTLQETVNYTPTNTTSLFTVEGIVTTDVSLTGAGNLLFYIQDATAGIAVFWSGATTNVPAAGDLVRVTGPLTQFNGLLEITPVFSNPSHSVTVISSNNLRPAATSFSFASLSDPAFMEALEGTYIVVSNVIIDATGPLTFSSTTYLITNSLGQTMALFVNAQTDIVGATKPTGPVTIFGVLGQFDASNPRTGEYQIIPSTFGEVLSPVKGATVRFTNFLSNLVRPGDLPTNTFVEHALRTGEKLTMVLRVTDFGGPVGITPVSNNLPASASWSYGPTAGTNLTATFTFQPVTGNAGNSYDVMLITTNGTSTGTNVWKVYVPTLAEQQVVITEILANPTTVTNAVNFNPLGRAATWATNSGSLISFADEYIEVANFSSSSIEFVGWTVYDAVQLRHEFGDFFSVASSNSFILYGGPLNGFDPGIPGLKTPASTSAGLALNNTGTESITLRNISGNMVARVVYAGTDLGTISSVSRFPTYNSPFVRQEWITTNLVSPNVQFNGLPWNQPALALSSPTTRIDVVTNAARITFPAVAGHVSSLWQAGEVANHFRVTSGTLFTNTSGLFTVPGVSNTSHQFFFISTQ